MFSLAGVARDYIIGVYPEQDSVVAIYLAYTILIYFYLFGKKEKNFVRWVIIIIQNVTRYSPILQN